MHHDGVALNKLLSVCISVCLNEADEVVRDIETTRKSTLAQIREIIAAGGDLEKVFRQVIDLAEESSLRIGSLQLRLDDLHQQFESLQQSQELAQLLSDLRSEAA